MPTERLLEQSQSQAQELQSRQEQLHQSNEDLAEQAGLLAERNSDVESKYQEVEEAKRLMEQKATELSVSSKYKSEFIANMSHELRTPLNSLLVLAEQLQNNPDGNLTERQVEYASVIRSSGVDLLKLLNDILDLAKVESNTIDLEIGDLALADLRDTILQNFSPIAEGRGLTFTVELDDRLPATIATDPHRLRQVLKNLLSNAFKFTERGEVTMRMELSADGWNPDHDGLARAGSVIAISVKDTGIGIQKDLQAAMFEAFAQADGTTARRYGGTGLGLSISRNLVGLLGGEITLTSEPQVGSTFTVYLPVALQARAADSTTPTSAPPEHEADLQVPPNPVAAVAGNGVPSVHPQETPPVLADTAHGEPSNGAPPRPAINGHELYSEVRADMTVLIVDDDFRNRFALTALLERGKLGVVEADSGKAALDKLAEQPDIDLVLMDIMMPDMDGYETIAAIRMNSEHSDLPIIAVTGKVVGGERERCLAAGASDYIPKPVDTAELMEAVGVWLPATT